MLQRKAKSSEKKRKRAALVERKSPFLLRKLENPLAIAGKIW
jgi:3-polyprenyl-4-hydroxybenzoate decarboxylase